jgi:hypothetical protein
MHIHASILFRASNCLFVYGREGLCAATQNLVCAHLRSLSDAEFLDICVYRCNSTDRFCKEGLKSHSSVPIRPSRQPTRMGACADDRNDFPIRS